MVNLLLIVLFACLFGLLVGSYCFVLAICLPVLQLACCFGWFVWFVLVSLGWLVLW